ncbi:uncharacterized protein TNCV_5134871 [Trichonephila clavipes]|nr:uncharacterized protein TNCV_5134871 [Trichonephila clavipes]
MQYLNFGRKYEAAAATVDISRLPRKIVSLDKSSNERDRDKAFLQRRGINIQLFALRSRKPGDFERKISDVGRKIRESNPFKNESFILFTQKSTSFNKFMKEEMQLLNSTEIPPNIIKICEALKTIPPMSVESEKAYSAAGLLVTKLRTRLSDKSINCLCFLKSYFKNE